MDTQVRTPQLVFMQPQRLVVPLFQRPYVWNRESQWEPLWNDLIRVTERILAGQPSPPHFLGAVVLQQVQNPVGSLQTRVVIDGQQRLTTLQILLDALHAELLAAGVNQPAMRLEALIVNQKAFCEKPEDRFKVWPTNRDRPSFNDVMGAEPPIDYEALKHRGERLVEAHRYFSAQAREWLNQEGPNVVALRGERIEHAARELLQMVVIDLTAEENAQEIFETLNARGAHLTAADLIKNFIFQRLLEIGADVEATYDCSWKEFETGFWEKEVNFGRLLYSRSSVFINHWLIAQTGDEVVAREVFTRFKRYADHESVLPMTDLVAQMHRAGTVYRSLVEGATANNPISRLQLFAYRTSVLESEVFKPVLLWLFDPEQEPIPDVQVHKVLEVIESWLVRRMIVRAQSKGYNLVVVDLITQLKKGDRSRVGDLVEGYFASQASVARYWPDDSEVSRELGMMQAYLRIRRGRLRMLLEAVEDYLRGWKGSEEGLGGERVARGKYHIEHVMPRKWLANWPLAGGTNEAERDRLVHRLGNLTLLTSKLNGQVSNSAWPSKREALRKHDVLLMNKHLLDVAADDWSDDKIQSRTSALVDAVLQIWSVPDGHRSQFSATEDRARSKVDVATLIGAGLLEPGATLYARRRDFAHRTATVLPDGRIDVDGVAFETPSGAAKALSGRGQNGWWFFLVDKTNKKSLRDLLGDYIDQTAADIDDESALEDDDFEDDD